MLAVSALFPTQQRHPEEWSRYCALSERAIAAYEAYMDAQRSADQAWLEYLSARYSKGER
jgi:hypothetical protein